MSEEPAGAVTLPAEGGVGGCEGGLVGSRAGGPSTPTQGNMRAARLQTALKDTVCTVAVHDFHKVLGGGSRRLRVHSGRATDVSRGPPMSAVWNRTPSSFVWVSPWQAGTVARSHYLLDFTLVCSGSSTIWREDVTGVLANGGKPQMMNTVHKKCPLEKSSLAVQCCGHFRKSIRSSVCRSA